MLRKLQLELHSSCPAMAFISIAMKPVLTPDRPFCSEQQSHKFKKAGLSYLIYLSILDSKIIHFDGPYDAGTGDATIFKNGMMQMMPHGKMMIGDKGFAHKDIAHLVFCPNPLDDEET